MERTIIDRCAGPGEERRVAAVQSVQRAFEILRALALSPAGVSEVAREIGLPKSTVARLLATLEELDAVERIGDGTVFRVGPAVGALSAAAGTTQNLGMIVRPYLRDLAEESGEDAGLAVPAGSAVHFIAQVDAVNDVQVRDWTGASMPAHVVPSGLVMMAYWPEPQLQRFFERDLDAMTPNTMTDEAEIRLRLAGIRDVGYVWALEEFTIGINSVAAPVFANQGVPAGAVHIHGPAYRFPREANRDRIAAAVRNAAKNISDMLAKSGAIT